MMLETDEIADVGLAKEAALKEYLATLGPIAIAYSGGVDSTYLSAVAHEALGADAAMILADSPSIPRSEVQQAEEIALLRGWNFSKIATHEFENEQFLQNNGTRCYFCKFELFTRMDAYAREHGIKVLAYGEIAEDRLDPTRLGARAAREHRVVAPLAEVDLHKEEIRALSRRRDLPTWDKASFACLSSRFPTGTRVDIQQMQRVELAEEILKRHGLHQYRARHHGDTCRIECGQEDFALLLAPEVRQAIVAGIRQAGYKTVTLDLAGYEQK